MFSHTSSSFIKINYVIPAWNSLPLSVINSPSPDSFKSSVTTYTLFLATLSITNPFLPLSLINFHVIKITSVWWEDFIISSCYLSSDYALALTYI